MILLRIPLKEWIELREYFYIEIYISSHTKKQFSLQMRLNLFQKN